MSLYAGQSHSETEKLAILTNENLLCTKISVTDCTCKHPHELKHVSQTTEWLILYSDNVLTREFLKDSSAFRHEAYLTSPIYLL